jgi:hypothetical protein
MVLAIAIATAPFASALAGPAEDKATARELAKEGIAAEHKGDCNVAIERLERAESLFHAPPHLQYLARCYTKVGRLVDATETWRKLTLETLSPNAPPAFRDAVTEAAAELPKLEPRLARLTVNTAQKYDGLVVEVDGKAWPSAALDVPRVIDPGKHVVRARATGFKTKEAAVDISEGKSDSVTLTLEAGIDPGGPGPSASASATTSATAAPTSTGDTGGRRSPLVTVGWVTAGAGLVALGAGVFFGVSANRKFEDLEKACPNRGNCADVPDLEQRKTEVRRLDTATNILLIGGGVLVLAGLSMVLFAPSASGAAKGGTTAMTLQFAPTASGGHVALTGSF